MGVYALPVNSTLVQFIYDLKKQEQEILIEHLCCSCKDKKATKVCYNCDPLGCKLCENCCNKEHKRDFPPIRAHKPMPIEGHGKNIPNKMCCTYHCEELTHYSEKHRKFACKHYLSDEPDDVKADYVQIEVAVQTLKSRLSPVMDSLEGYLKRLQDAHQNISTIQNQLIETGPSTIMEIQQRFTNFKDIFLKRKKSLLQHVEACVSV